MELERSCSDYVSVAPSVPLPETRLPWAYLESPLGAVHASAAAFLVDFWVCKQSASDQVRWVKADGGRRQSRGVWLWKGEGLGSEQEAREEKRGSRKPGQQDQRLCPGKALDTLLHPAVSAEGLRWGYES